MAGKMIVNEKKMAVRPREVIDIRNQAFSLKLNVLAAQISAKEGRTVTKREIWLRALATAHPSMAADVTAELSPEAPDI